MRARNNIIAASVLLLILVLNIATILMITQRQSQARYQILMSQSQLCGERLEKTLLQFSSDINHELDKYNYSEIFGDPQKFTEATQSLRMFYTKYRDLISNISVYDNRKNFYAIYLDKEDRFGTADRFVVDSFPRRYQIDLNSRHRVEQHGNLLKYFYPYFGDDVVNGNVMVEVDIKRLAQGFFELYPLGGVLDWQWILDESGEILLDNFPGDSVRIGDLAMLTDSVKGESQGYLEHEIILGGQEPNTVHTDYYPLSVYSRKMGVLFSARKIGLIGSGFSVGLWVALLGQVLITLLVIYFLTTLERLNRREKRLKLSEIVFRQIIEHYPVGIMIIDEANIIRNINSAAQKMLFLGKSENLTGQDFSKQFLISNKYLLSDGPSPFLDDSHYLYYEKDGMETVIYRTEKITNIGGEELRLIALIDVSPLEKSRKGEVAANRAKSDFLAAMSHEIRTPMNGILGMVNDLLEHKTPADIRDKLGVIKRSADLLMTIINDILDFSKIEAGRMMLEEIPFNLVDEMELVGELFRPLAREKGLDLEIRVNGDVPVKLIGVPFRLRQVISNLVSNAVKFTEKGRIVIGATLTESFKSQVNILFTVEDTGIGIPQDRIKEIFGSYTQARGSVTRKFGGTGLGTAIAKQLVELMHGEIWVESPSSVKTEEEYPGSKFSFTIEAYSNERIPKEFNFDHITRFADINALILTKESDTSRNTMARLLEKFGLNVVTKIYQDSNVDSVVHHIQVKKGEYQLVVLVDKNQLDGFALAQELQNANLNDFFPIILVSSNDKSGNYKTCRKLGIDYYLIEPFETKEVFDIIAENFPGIEDHKRLEPMLNALPDNLSILLAEDNLINQKVAQSIFKNIGYEIDIAKNGQEAVEMVQKNDYDVIFMDLLMPELDGYQACQEIRRTGKDMPVIAMSADDDDQVRKAARDAGMNDYISKPARVETVKQLLIKLFSKTL